MRGAARLLAGLFAITADLAAGRVISPLPTTYRNPVIAGDYSDPDAIRVGNDFYLVASSFTNIPGLPILQSRDLVHWKIIAHAINRLPPDDHYRRPRRGGGVWAPTIRYHGGEFLIYYADPDFGVFVVRAKSITGPWSRPQLVDAARGAIDPAPFWDDDGSAWLVHAWAASRAGFNNVITLKRLSDDGLRTLDKGRPIIDGATMPPVMTSLGLRPWQTTEGPKLYKRGGHYYIFAPSGSVKGGWQGVFRSRSLTGPYEGRDVLDQGNTATNGPHQGAWVSTPSGEDWFLHFQDTDSYGRRVHLQPMRWREGWPVIGADPADSGRGAPVLDYQAPRLPNDPRTSMQHNDEFEGALSPAWQWNANPDNGWADLTRVPGKLRLHAVPGSPNLWEMGNLLSQKLPGLAFSATTKLIFDARRAGERTGLALFGADYGWIGLEETATGTAIVQVSRPNASTGGQERVAAGPSTKPGKSLWLRVDVRPWTTSNPPPDFAPFWPSMLRSTTAVATFFYSTDGRRFVRLGAPVRVSPGKWVGAQLGIFAQAPLGQSAFSSTTEGWADFDWFRVRIR